jgi:hypothetical protein
MRTPISRLRCSTVYETTPPTPTTARITALEIAWLSRDHLCRRADFKK